MPIGLIWSCFAFRLAVHGTYFNYIDLALYTSPRKRGFGKDPSVVDLPEETLVTLKRVITAGPRYVSCPAETFSAPLPEFGEFETGDLGLMCIILRRYNSGLVEPQLGFINIL